MKNFNIGANFVENKKLYEVKTVEKDSDKNLEQVLINEILNTQDLKNPENVLNNMHLYSAQKLIKPNLNSTKPNIDMKKRIGEFMKSFEEEVEKRLQFVTKEFPTLSYAQALEAKVLAEAGLEFTLPRGAFYFFVKSPIADETEFVKELAEACVLAVPGRGFGCPGYIRLTFCVSEKVISASADAFKKVMEKYK